MALRCPNKRRIEIMEFNTALVSELYRANHLPVGSFTEPDSSGFVTVTLQVKGKFKTFKVLDLGFDFSENQIEELYNLGLIPEKYICRMNGRVTLSLPNSFHTFIDWNYKFTIEDVEDLFSQRALPSKTISYNGPVVTVRLPQGTYRFFKPNFHEKLIQNNLEDLMEVYDAVCASNQRKYIRGCEITALQILLPIFEAIAAKEEEEEIDAAWDLPMAA
jgi:hypothetical protein